MDSNIVVDEKIKTSYNMIFHDGKKEVGELCWGDGVLKFKGDAKGSAKELFDYLKTYIDQYTEEQKI